MRIERLDTILINIPLRIEQRTSFSTRTSMTQCLVHATADSGQTGWGEASGGAGGWAPACQTIIDAMKDQVIGRAPADVHSIRRQLFDTRYWKNAGRLAHLSFGAIETALLDLEGQRLGLPMWKLLGSKIRGAIDFFGFLNPTANSDDLALEAAKMEEDGFRILYLKIGGDDHEDLGRVAAVRRAIRPGTRLRVDANGAWDRNHAVQAIEALSHFDLDFVEQPTPLDDLPGLAHVRSAVRVPICANEVAWHPAEWREVLRHQAADVLCINVSWCGGPTQFVAIAELAAKAGVRVVRHTIDVGIGDHAALHVLATVPNALDGNQIMGTHLGDDVLEAGPLMPRGGTIPVPDTPGLGATVSEERIASLHRRFLLEGNARAFSVDHRKGGEQ